MGKKPTKSTHAVPEFALALFDTPNLHLHEALGIDEERNTAIAAIIKEQFDAIHAAPEDDVNIISYLNEAVSKAANFNEATYIVWSFASNFTRQQESLLGPLGRLIFGNMH